MSDWTQNLGGLSGQLEGSLGMRKDCLERRGVRGCEDGYWGLLHSSNWENVDGISRSPKQDISQRILSVEY